MPRVRAPGEIGTLTELSDVNPYVSSVWLTSGGPIRGVPGMRANRVQEVVEQRPAVVRARGSFRVILHREDRLFAVPKPFDGSVVQVHVRHFELRRSWNRAFLALHRESV